MHRSDEDGASGHSQFTHGGARPGAGRKKGGKNAITKARIARGERAIDEAGITPLEVMLLSMKAAWEKAQDANTEEGERNRQLAIALGTAKDAAPYVHPKLQPVDGDGSSEQKHGFTSDVTAFVLSLMTPDQLHEARRLALEQQAHEQADYNAASDLV